MAQPYVGEIRMFAGNFEPAGWAFCNGRMLPISENETLFQLIGTTYGGDGQETFQLPDLRGRVPVHNGSTMPFGAPGGVESVTLATQQLPVHSHPLIARGGPGSSSDPGGALLAAAAAPLYIEQAPSQALSSQAIVPVGGGQPHENRQPFLSISFIISLFGIYPSQT
jgi:microcystin-dependent protein